MAGDVIEQSRARWAERILAQARGDNGASFSELQTPSALLPEVCQWLFTVQGYFFASLIVEELDDLWELRYVFYGDGEAGWVHVVVRQPLTETTFSSISHVVPAVDWHEREAEDLFGLKFQGHPLLGDFVLHVQWPEGTNPMRKAFDGRRQYRGLLPAAEWHHRQVLRSPGAFTMSIGPVFSGATEPAQFLLDTIGETIANTDTRLFFKYRGVEKLAEGYSADEALLLAERFCATTAFAHALAFCQAVEAIAQMQVSRRAQTLRVLLAELERLRHHAGVIHEICESTGLAVGTSQAAILEEELLRLSGAFSGHRYLFGVATPGGLTRDFDDSACHAMVQQAAQVLARLQRLQDMLVYAGSFLDRLEEVGTVTERQAQQHGMVGPVARASGVARDLRQIHPYAGYEQFRFTVAKEEGGDGYARLRVLFTEAEQSVAIMQQAVAALAEGPVTTAKVPIRPGAALGWVEAPRGAAFHWVRISKGGRIGEGLRTGPESAVSRYRIATPSFANWHGLHLAVERFAFQDFPIILATFGLSVAESDR